MNLMPLLNYLQDNGAGAQGENLFTGMMPAHAERAVLLRNPLHGTPIDYELPGYYKTDFQVIVRTSARDYDAGEALINMVLALLTFDARQVEEQFFNYCRPRTMPVAFPLSDGNLVEFSVMFDCCFVQG